MACMLANRYFLLGRVARGDVLGTPRFIYSDTLRWISSVCSLLDSQPVPTYEPDCWSSRVSGQVRIPFSSSCPSCF
jgi:hypothetical protein